MVDFSKLSDSEIDLIAPELDSYLAELEKLRDLDIDEENSNFLSR